MSRLDLLTANDQQGIYPASHYSSNKNPKPRARLEGEIRTDICVIGAGFTGLSAALSLAEMGYKVIVLEAQRVGFGASGRNGGQIGSGQRLEPDELEKQFGFERAKAMFELGHQAHDYVLEICRKHNIDIGYQKGIAHLENTSSDVRSLHERVEKISKRFNIKDLDLIDTVNKGEFISSELYAGGVCHWDGGHGDPLALALGVAKAAEKAGAVIYENSRVTELLPHAKTKNGAVKADYLLLACNGYLGDLHRKTGRYVMPINNFIVATEPLGEVNAKALLPKNTAVADSKFVVNYFRRSPDHRLLFGGGESYGYRFPSNLAEKARKPMLQVFPQLKNTKIDYAWGGTLAITMSRLPYVAREGNLFVSAGYSGHGVALANYMGHLIAQAIDGDSRGFELMAAVKHRAFPGGKTMRHPLLIAAMLWYQMRDKIGV